MKTEGFSLTSTESHARGRGPAPLRCEPGSPVVVLTVDGSAPANWETLVRLGRSDTPQCDSCHGSRTFRDYVARKPNFDNIDLTGVTGLNAPNLTWDTVKRLREDAKLAADYGIDGIIVSNHSGRVVDSGRDNRGLAGDHRGSRRSNGRSCRQRLFVAARTSSRHWPWAHKPYASDGPICGALVLRSAGCRARPGDPASGNACRHAGGRSASIKRLTPALVQRA